MVVFDESWLSGMGFRAILRLILTTDHFIIEDVFFQGKIVHVSLAQITSVDIFPGRFNPEISISYFNDKEIFRVFTVTTRKNGQWGRAFETVGVRVIWPQT